MQVTVGLSQDCLVFCRMHGWLTGEYDGSRCDRLKVQRGLNYAAAHKMNKERGNKAVVKVQSSEVRGSGVLNDTG